MKKFSAKFSKLHSTSVSKENFQGIVLLRKFFSTHSEIEQKSKFYLPDCQNCTSRAHAEQKQFFKHLFAHHFQILVNNLGFLGKK